MSRGKWNKIKQAKFFNVRIYRKVTTWVILSLFLNVLLCLGLIYSYLHKPIRTYYATSGITSPIELNALAAPNETSEALLPPDPISDEETKLIPD